jgi:hypothetical protein
MARYKVTQELTQTVIQTFWEEFDTSDQENWDRLLENAAENLETDDKLDAFPLEAPEDPELWLRLYEHLYYAEYENQEEDNWVSDNKGFTEYDFSIEKIE